MSRLVVPVDCSISETSQQERAEGIREVGLRLDYRHSSQEEGNRKEAWKKDAKKESRQAHGSLV